MPPTKNRRRDPSYLKIGQPTIGSKEHIVERGIDRIDTRTGEKVDEQGIPYLNQHLKPPRRRQRTPEQAKKINQRIEQIRLMMTLSRSTGDIIRALARPVEAGGWGLSESGVKNYIRCARKRQQQILNRSPAEAFSDSLSYWSQKLQEAYTRYKRGLDDLEKARLAMTSADEALKQAVSSAAVEPSAGDQKRIASAQKLIASCQHRMETARLMIRGASLACDEYQDRIDRLCGNLASDRIAQILAEQKGEKLPEREPMSHEDLRRQILQHFLQQFPEIPTDVMRSILPPGYLGASNGHALDEREAGTVIDSTASILPQREMSATESVEDPASPGADRSVREGSDGRPGYSLPPGKPSAAGGENGGLKPLPPGSSNGGNGYGPLNIPYETVREE